MEFTDLDPKAVRHQVGKIPSGAIAVDAGRFANPFDVAGLDPTARMGAVVQYAVRLAGRRDDLIAVHREAGGRDVSCTCPLGDLGCHRGVLLDTANPPRRPRSDGGSAMAITVRRPWASMLLVPHELGGKSVENSTFSTDYRGPLMIYAGSEVDTHGLTLAQRHGLDAAWHEGRRGWLGAVVLTGVHRARRHCCTPWGQAQRPGGPPIYHWVLAHPHRLAAPTWATGPTREERRGFPGLRSMSWSVLMRTADDPAQTGCLTVATR
ncbi:hypothetical protein KIH27_20310 [Mycobacterium sp. M1]|uniref:RES domain-containing protein n=1 Tax=Mycolicibacter acidiphilus TaxID=2835306 RepID=A0ABS5RNP8_9MYCO|nr:hypothetical protein [Mycolicibacter acidiphilus]MBS9535930.1 hypothetical protein [Mycolicibacter acidiphilus]